VNIIGDGDNVVGKTTDIIEYFKNLMIKDIKNLDLFDEETEELTIEANILNVRKTYELFTRLITDIINEEIDEETYLKISSTPQDDCYLYKKLVEEEN